ncbi:MAG: hypothetical protein MUD08_07115, partial [Cytophagales bacterium]|nr:hypothetical protein [Cytophagales bacterium]
FTVYRLPFTVYRLPFTVYRLPFTVYRLPFTVSMTKTRQVTAVFAVAQRLFSTINRKLKTVN